MLRREPLETLAAFRLDLADTPGDAARASLPYTTSGSTSLRAARASRCTDRKHDPKSGDSASIGAGAGVHSVHTRDVSDVLEMVECACRAALEQSFAKTGETIVITAGMPFGTPGATDLLRIAQVPA